jgi:hypothetical protein
MTTSMTSSITSKEEVYSSSEIEITHTVVAWRKTEERKGEDEAKGCLRLIWSKVKLNISGAARLPADFCGVVSFFC